MDDERPLEIDGLANTRGRFLRSWKVPSIIGTALLMSSLNASSISVALPSMSRDLGVAPLRLNVVLTAYILAQVIFLPASAWLADRFGATRMLQVAILLFAASSLACGLAQSLTVLVAARITQGLAGAMIAPVGRLILLRSTPRNELISALSVLSLPVQLGPLAGPLIGGLVVGVLGWHWVFLINLPVAVIAFALVARHVPLVPARAAGRLDWRGSMLIGIGSASFIYALDLLLQPDAEALPILAAFALALVAAVFYWRHAKRRHDAAVDLKLFQIATFRSAVIGGAFFRLIPGATPFLFALMFQVAFGMSALAAGTMTFMTAVGSLLMKTVAPPLLRRFGFRRVLVSNCVLTSVIFMSYALITPDMPSSAIMAALAAGGFFRALQFTATWSLAFADISEAQMGRATTTTAIVQQMVQSISTASAAVILYALMQSNGQAVLDAWTVHVAFVVIGLLSLISLAWFAKLPASAGDSLTQ